MASLPLEQLLAFRIQAMQQIRDTTRTMLACLDRTAMAPGETVKVLESLYRRRQQHVAVLQAQDAAFRERLLAWKQQRGRCAGGDAGVVESLLERLEALIREFQAVDDQLRGRIRQALDVLSRRLGSARKARAVLKGLKVHEKPSPRFCDRKI